MKVSGALAWHPDVAMSSNTAKAVIPKGYVEMAEVGSGKNVTIEAGPWQGDNQDYSQENPSLGFFKSAN